MVQQRGFRQKKIATRFGYARPRFRLLLANRDLDPLWKMYFPLPIQRSTLCMIWYENVYLPFPQNCEFCDAAARGFQLVSLFLLVKYVLKCGVGHTWRRTSASFNYERFHGH